MPYTFCELAAAEFKMEFTVSDDRKTLIVHRLTRGEGEGQRTLVAELSTGTELDVLLTGLKTVQMVEDRGWDLSKEGHPAQEPSPYTQH